MKKIILASLVLLSTNTFAQSIDLSDLYARYTEADFSSMELAEFNQTVDFQANIVSAEENLQGGALFEIATLDDPETAVARITPANDAEFFKVKAGKKVNLQCQLEMTMGSEYLAFGDCVLK